MRRVIEKFGRRIARQKWRLLSLIKTKPAPDAVLSSYDVWLTPNPSDTTFGFYLSGGYGRFLVKLLAAQKQPFVFIDIGANQGLYSILAQKNVCCTQVYSFEPVPQTAALLRKNVALNKCRDVVVCMQAIADTSGTAEIHVSDSHSGAATMRGDMEGFRNSIKIETVDAQGLSEIVTPGRDRIVVKIDVEGQEMAVLHQLMAASFASRIDTIFYECDEEWVDPDALKSFLQEYGFRSFEKVGGRTHYDVLASK